MPHDLEILCDTIDMWSFQFRCWSTITPKNFALVTLYIASLHKMTSPWGFSGFFLDMKTTHIKAPKLHMSGIKKSTHISMISNSVTHLRSLPTPQLPISPETPRERRYRRAEHRFRRAGRCPALSADIVASNGECFVMFHNVLSVSWCFTSGSQCFTTFHNVLRHFTMFYKCFMMYYDV